MCERSLSMSLSEIVIIFVIMLIILKSGTLPFVLMSVIEFAIFIILTLGDLLIPTNEEIEEVFKLINTLLPNTKVLYGGSANEKMRLGY